MFVNKLTKRLFFYLLNSLVKKFIWSGVFPCRTYIRHTIAFFSWISPLVQEPLILKVEVQFFEFKFLYIIL
ncbi:hypothetical protein MOUN0_K03510 [Monosporozyma unispora]